MPRMSCAWTLIGGQSGSGKEPWATQIASRRRKEYAALDMGLFWCLTERIKCLGHVSEDIKPWYQS